MTPETLAALHARAMEVPGPWSAKDFADLLAQKGTFLIPMLHAFALGRVTVDEAELLTLATDPAHRRQGLARACLSAFETEAAKRGAAIGFLEVAAANTPALDLYESASWVRIGRRKDYYKAPEGRIDAVLMSKRLGTD